MKMPLLHHILSTNDINIEPPESLIVENVLTGIRKSVPFETQVASELYWLGRQNDYSLTDDFGPLRLPYPDTWMEWRIPSQVMIDGKMHDGPGECLAGAHLSEVTGPDGQLGISALMVFSDVGRHYPPRSLAMMLQLEIDKETGHARRDRPIVETFAESMSDHDRYLANSTIRAHINPAFLALNLMNCRNVTTRVAGTVPISRSGSAKRRKEPKIEFHTIVLPGMPTTREQQPKGRKSAQEESMAIHRVRGHFKTFTADAPLLGKYVGTYWWGWQVRGSKKNGIIVSDYEMAKP